MSATNPVPKIYRAVIEDVIKNVKESFLNESVDEQVLNELKQLWESKLLQSRAVEFMPTDVNVKVSLRYPHNTDQATTSQAGSSRQQPQQHQQQQQTQKQQQQSQQQQQTHQQQSTQQQQQQQPAQTATTARIVHGAGGGQFVYVSQHPTLGNVPMSGAAAQAAMALQNPQRLPRAIIQPSIVGVQPTQVIHLQPQQGQPQVFPQFPGVAPRVIYAPAAVAQAQPPTSEQKPATRIIQVDGASDSSCVDEIPTCSKSRDSNLHECNSNRGKMRPRRRPEIIIQMDGGNSDSEDDDDDEEDEEDYDNIPVAGIGGASGDVDEELGEEEEPLNSEDDVSDEDPMDLFDTDNVVVCQYDKIARTRNRWKFHLKDGIMNLRSKDYVFHKANGDAEW